MPLRYSAPKGPKTTFTGRPASRNSIWFWSRAGKLLKKRLRPWFASNRQADRLTFKDVFRHAVKHGLIPTDSCERWLWSTGTTATTLPSCWFAEGEARDRSVQASA